MGENSPAFQRRDSGEGAPSPAGTAAIDSLSRPCGTYPSRTLNPVPPLRDRAIVFCPSGTILAFSLIQVIAVLAILSVLALALLPVVIRRIDQAARDRDIAELSGMAGALRSVIQRTGQIPDTTTLVATLANEMAVSSNQVALNSRKLARTFLADPNLWIGSANGQLPYLQSTTPLGTGTNSGGLDMPGLNLRLMILSSLNLPLPTSIDFNTAWAAAEDTVPAGWPASWAGRGRDLRIQRLDLTPLFYHVILNPIDTNKFGSFAIESGQVASATNSVTGIVSNSWYLKGTALRLYNTNSSPTTYTMETKLVVQSDFSYVFEDAAWRGQLSGRGPNAYSASDSSSWSGAFAGFMGLATTFTNYSTPTGASGVTTKEILRSYFELMNNYNFWVLENFVPSQDTAWGILNADETEFSRIMNDSLK
jgi:type II secretory pathway pseudopilin PulG